MMKQLKRTLKSVTDLETGNEITSDMLLSADLAEYDEIRKTATRARLAGERRYACNKCGHAVYAPKDQNSRPYWKHHAGAPENCPWWTGDPQSPDQVSARQFAGRQEGPLHLWLKSELAKALEVDDQCSDVQVEKYIISENGRRRPDVSAKHQDKRLAFEVQLATTQLPTIIGKRDFYDSQGIRLIWVTWNFELRPIERVPQAFLDIYFEHEQNFLSVDPATLKESFERKKLILKAHASRGGLWQSEVITLEQLSWNTSGLP